MLTVRPMGTPAECPLHWKKKKRYLAAFAIITVFVLGCFPEGGGNGQQASLSGSDGGSYVEGVGVPQDLMPTGPRGLNLHVPNTNSVKYNTAPPTSGNHWDRPARCGFYEEQLPDERVVHNLEHSHIVVSYNLPSDGQVDQLRGALEAVGLSKIWGVARSYDKLPSGTVALAAWGVLDTMQGVDGERIMTFFEAYSGILGPEKIACPGAVQ